MSDYSLTPNLGLYLPTYDADDEQWGFHLNDNAMTLDAAFSPTGGLFLPIAGGTMGGPVALAGISTAPLAVPGTSTSQIASTAFVTAAVAGRLADAPTDGQYYARTSGTWQPVLSLGGGTLSGPLLLAADPTVPLGAATAQYADGAVNRAGGPFLPLATGGTVAGATTFSSTLTAGASTFNGATTTSGTNTLTAGSAVGTNNVIRLTPAVAGSKPVISVPGPDANTYLVFTMVGQGYVQVPRLNLPATVVLSGSAIPEQTPLNIGASYSGTATDNRNLNLMNISGDNAVVPVAANGFTVTHNYGGAAMKGGRNAFNVNLVQSAATQNNSVFYQAVNFATTATQPELSGSTPALTGRSAVFAIGAYATLNPTATGYGTLSGYEQDIIAAAQPYQIVGINVVRLSGGFGTLYQAVEPSMDSAYRVGSSLNVANWVQGYTITGPSGQWAIDPVKGTLFKAFPGQGYSAFPPTCLAGVDLSYVAFSGSAWHSQGALIDGAGRASFNQLNLGNWTASFSSSGLTIDPGTRQVALAAVVAAGGSNYNVNEQFSFAGNGRGIVTAQTSGSVTAITILEYPTVTSPPANPVATTSLMFGGAGQGTGSGMTLTLTWSTAATLSLNPSGGATTIGGTTSHVGNASFGSGAQNILTIVPGAASSNQVVLSMSGTGPLYLGAGGTGAVVAGTGTFNGTLTTSGTAIIQAGSPAGSVNMIRLTPSATGTRPAITTAGVDTNVDLDFLCAGTGNIRLRSPVAMTTTVGFNNTAPIAKPTISGACAGNTAIKALLTALVAYGLVTDTTTA